MNAANLYEAKLCAPEAFAKKYSPSDVPSLPVEGFNRILRTVRNSENMEVSWKNIYRVRDALKPFLTPFVEKKND
jgi:hypothetical protein